MHPRIYVRNDAARVGTGLTVAQLRTRAASEAYSRRRTPVAGQSAAAMVERAARYLESGDASDLAAVRDFLTSHTYSYEKNDVGGFLAGAEMAIAFDWVYAGLDAASRTAAMSNIVATAESSARFLRTGQPDINHNYTYMALDTVAVCGLVLTGEPEPYERKGAEYLDLARRFLEGPGMALDTWKAREGAWGEGSHYTFHETLRTFVLALHAFRSASDLDYPARIRNDYGGFLAAAGRFLIACTRPDFTFERTGDTLASRATASLTVPLTVEMLAAAVDDRSESARLRSFARDLIRVYGRNAVRPEFGWGMRIFHDPAEEVEPSYKSLPLAMRLGAGTYEQLMFRDGWDADSTLITILAGDHFTDHQHFDKGQFLIYDRGALAVDSGAYDGMYRKDQHSGEYAPRTLAHNCLLIYDPQQPISGSYASDGGQTIIRSKQHHADWNMYLSHREPEGLHAARVTAWDAVDGQYGYADVDLAAAYAGRASAYHRRFVYLPAAKVFIVYDLVRSAKAEFDKRWLLHTMEAPRIGGRAVKNGIQRFADASSVAIVRQGSADLGRETVAYDGAMVMDALLPERRIITSVGGPGYEFWNPFVGRNYAVSSATAAGPLREAGAWRIEVSPSEPRVEDEFLNVFRIGAREGAGSVSRLIRADGGGATGVQVSGHAAVFVREGGRVRYFVDGGAQHVIVGLGPGRAVAVRVNGRRVAQGAATAGGVFRFEDRGRGRRVVEVE